MCYTFIMQKRNRLIVVLVGIAILISAGIYNSFKKEESPVDINLHGVQFLDTNGVKSALIEKNTQLLVINFWATWCPPCREEIPFFNKLSTIYSSQGVKFVGVSLDQELETIQTFTKTMPINYTSGLFTEDFSMLAQHMVGIPTTIFIDTKQNKIVKRVVGIRDYNYFDSLIQSFISNDAP